MTDNLKITELTANTSPAMGDYIPMVDDPSGTAATQRTTLQYLANLIRGDNLIYAGRSIKQVQNSASETSLAPSTATGSLTLAANYLTQGKTIHFKVSGYISSTGSPTVTFKLKVGSDTVLNSGAITIGPNYNSVMFHLEADWTIWTTGATGTQAMQGRIFIGTTVVPFIATGWNAVDTTGTLLLAITEQMSAADNGNIVTISNYTVEATN